MRQLPMSHPRSHTTRSFGATAGKGIVRPACGSLGLLLLAATLSGCVSNEEFVQASTDRDRWRTHAGILEKENRELRAVLNEWMQSHKALERRLAGLSDPAQRLTEPEKRDLGQAKERLRKLEQELTVLEARNQTLAEDRDAFRNWYQIYRERFNQAVLREQRLQRKSKVYERMVKNLEQEVKEGDLKLQEVEGRLTVSVIDRIVFDAGGVEVNPEGKKVLDKLANLLKGIDDKRIQVEGHTDNLPVRPASAKRYLDNWELSALRASAVVRYLHEKGGVDPTLLSAVGYGPYQPVATNDTPEGRRKNRRIEIVLTPLPKRQIQESPAPAPGASPP